MRLHFCPFRSAYQVLCKKPTRRAFLFRLFSAAHRLHCRLWQCQPLRLRLVLLRFSPSTLVPQGRLSAERQIQLQVQVFLQTSKSFLLRCNMEIYSQLLLIYLVLINLVSIIVTISDKVKAIKRKWRIPESTLLLLSALGGSVSMYITMLIIRHKTKHPKFMIGIPVIFALQCILVFLIWRYIYV